MATEHTSVDLRRWPVNVLKAALGHIGADATGGADSEALVACLLRAPLRDVRAALTALRVSTSDCVERADLLVRLLEASRAAAADVEECEPWPPGSVVRLMKLQNAPALNMQRATIVRYDPAVDRYEVRLDWDGSTKKIREENLILEEEAAADSEQDSRAADVISSSPPEHHICLDYPGEAEQVSAEAIEVPDAGAEHEEPDDRIDQAEAPPTACPADPASVDNGAGSKASEEPDDAGVAASMTGAASSEPGASPAAPEIRRRKRKFKDQPQPDAARAQDAGAIPAAEEQRGPETPPAAAEAIVASSPWVVRASAQVAKEALVPLHHESMPTRKPTKLRVGCRGLRQPEGAGRMANGLRALFWSGELCDVALVCGDTTLRAHKAVLAGQSNVFRRLLQDSAEVQLPEVSHPEAVRLMLEYLYEVGDEFGYSPALAGINSDVLRLADKFELPELRRRAAIFMASGLTTENAVERLQLCETFKLHDLRDRILEQLAVKKRALAEISTNHALAGYPQLMQEILKRVAGAVGPPQATPPDKSARAGT